MGCLCYWVRIISQGLLWDAVYIGRAVEEELKSVRIERFSVGQVNERQEVNDRGEAYLRLVKYTMLLFITCVSICHSLVSTTTACSFSVQNPR